MASASNDRTDSLGVEKVLAHFGIKGMKWGVRRDPATLAKVGKGLGVGVDLLNTGVRNKAQAKAYLKTAEDHKIAEAARLKLRVAGARTLSNKELQTVITRMNLEVQYTTLKKAQFEDSYVGAGAKWAGRFVNDVAKDAAGSWLKRPGSNFSGRTSSRVGGFVGLPRPAIDGISIRRAIEG